MLLVLPKGQGLLSHYFENDENLKSELRKLTYNYGLYDFCFWSDNGVFSKDKVDFGSTLLLETFLSNEGRENLDVLDVGCGYGLLGIVIADVLKANVVMTDVNKRAMHLATRNVNENEVSAKVTESDAYENVDGLYDVIITNPPIRVGKSVTLSILEGAKKHLKPDGNLWFVIHKDQGAKSMGKFLEKHYEIEIVNKSKGFYVFLAKNR